MNRFLIAAVLAAVVCSGSAAAVTADSPSASESSNAAAATTDAAAAAPVTRLHDTLIEIMKNAGTLGFEGRRQTLEPVLSQVFDFPTMAQAAVGQYWGQMNESERKELLAVFEEFSIATYASRFDGYSGQRFETLGEEPAPRNAVWVKTQLVLPSDSDNPDGRLINLNYLVHDFGSEGWRIVDVYLGGAVSEMATKRSEYVSVIRREGVSGLLETLATKTRSLKTS